MDLPFICVVFHVPNLRRRLWPFVPENAERKQELKKFGKVGKIFQDSNFPDQ